MKTTLALILVLTTATAFAQSPTPARTSRLVAAAWIVSPSPNGTMVVNGTNYVAQLFTNPPTTYGRQPLIVSGTAVPTAVTIQLAIAKRAATQTISRAYYKALGAGMTVTTGTGSATITLTLPSTAADQQQFNALLSLLNTAPMPPTLTIADVNGNPQTVTVAQYYTLIGSYGQQISTLWNELMTAKSSVAAVTGTAALAKISLADPTGQ